MFAAYLKFSAATSLSAHIDTIQDPKLEDRAHSLPALIHARWADSTTEKYARAWSKWEMWCRRYSESQCPPVTLFYIALYINDMVIDCCKFGALDAAASGIRWGHLTVGLSNPMDNILVKTILEGAKRVVGKPKGENQKKPMSLEMLQRVIAHYGPNPDLITD